MGESLFAPVNSNSSRLVYGDCSMAIGRIVKDIWLSSFSCRFSRFLPPLSALTLTYSRTPPPPHTHVLMQEYGRRMTNPGYLYKIYRLFRSEVDNTGCCQDIAMREKRSELQEKCVENNTRNYELDTEFQTHDFEALIWYSGVHRRSV